MFLNTLIHTLADVDAAHMAMNEGSYGNCLECGEPIASRRLQPSVGHHTEYGVSRRTTMANSCKWQRLVESEAA